LAAAVSRIFSSVAKRAKWLSEKCDSYRLQPQQLDWTNRFSAELAKSRLAIELPELPKVFTMSSTIDFSSVRCSGPEAARYVLSLLASAGTAVQLPRRRRVEVLEGVRRQVGFPATIRSKHRVREGDLDLWAYQRGVTLDFSRPGKSTDNALIEAFNGRLRAECLNARS
jgi:hypothetical protein